MKLPVARGVCLYNSGHRKTRQEQPPACFLEHCLYVYLSLHIIDTKQHPQVVSLKAFVCLDLLASVDKLNAVALVIEPLWCIRHTTCLVLGEATIHAIGLGGRFRMGC